MVLLSTQNTCVNLCFFFISVTIVSSLDTHDKMYISYLCNDIDIQDDNFDTYTCHDVLLRYFQRVL